MVIKKHETKKAAFPLIGQPKRKAAPCKKQGKKRTVTRATQDNANLVKRIEELEAGKWGYLYAPNFFANYILYYNDIGDQVDIKDTLIFRRMINEEVAKLMRSISFRKHLDDLNNQMFSRLTHHNEDLDDTIHLITDKALRPVFAAIAHNPELMFVKIKRDEDGTIIVRYGDDQDLRLEHSVFTRPYYTLIGNMFVTFNTDAGVVIEQFANREIQEFYIRTAGLVGSFFQRCASQKDYRNGKLETLAELEHGDQVVVPFAAMAELKASKNKKFTHLSLERGNNVTSFEKQTLKATDGKGDWTRTIEKHTDTAAYDLERSKTVWEVIGVNYQGGGTGHGRHDVYPDGLHLTLVSSERKEVITFYVSGCFTCQIPPMSVLVRK